MGQIEVMDRMMVSKVKLLGEQTLVQLGVCVSDLLPSSDTYVLVQCERCGEVLRRRWCDIDKLHRCPIIMGRQKWCTNCHTYLPITSFDSFSWCNDCVNDERLDAWIDDYYAIKRSQCGRSIPFLSVHDLKELWIRQDGRCFYSHVKLKSAELDRINKDVGYVFGNVVWVSADRFGKDGRCPVVEGYFYDLEKASLVRLEYKLIHEDARLPYQKRSTDVGHDLYSVEDVIVPPRSMVNVHTGIIISCPPGWYLVIEGRSSLWKCGIMPSHGIIDSGYNSELQVALFNYTDNPYEVRKYDRVAQIILHRVYNFDLALVDEFGPDYNSRGTAGFGSSGR